MARYLTELLGGLVNIRLTILGKIPEMGRCQPMPILGKEATVVLPKFILVISAQWEQVKDDTHHRGQGETGPQAILNSRFRTLPDARNALKLQAHRKLFDSEAGGR